MVSRTGDVTSMRLWHEILIPYLDNKRLLGQHRECCALRGKGWGRKHSTVDYVFNYPKYILCLYHSLVIDECEKRGFNINQKWKNLLGDESTSEINTLFSLKFEWIYNFKYKPSFRLRLLYKEHDHKYMEECLENLKSKNAKLINADIDYMLAETKMFNALLGCK